MNVPSVHIFHISVPIFRPHISLKPNAVHFEGTVSTSTRAMRDSRFKVPGKYRRAFSWRISDGSPDSLESNLTGMMRLATSDFPEILEDYLTISRKRQRNWTALSRLQMHLMEELLIQEGAVKHYKETLRRLGDDTDAELPRDEQSQDIRFSRVQLFFHRLYANACRAIGDGIAWRALGYDRAVTRTMCERQSQQTLAAEGTIQELREWSSQFDRGMGLAIFNALTNCLSVGDVTVVRDDGSVEVVEVKSSKTKSSRKIRQKEKMREVVSRLETGEGPVDGQKIHIEILPVAPETGLDRVEKLLDLASVRGWAAEKISNTLYVEAFDFRKPPDETAKNALRGIREAVVGEWDRRGDFWVEMSTLDTLAFSPNCAPFSVYPFDAKTCIDLLIGARNYTAYLNESAVAREFEYRGWTAALKTPADFVGEADKDAALEQMRQSRMMITKGQFHAEIPPADFMRMHIEALRPKTLIDAYEAILKLGPREGGCSLMLFDGEPQLWD